MLTAGPAKKVTVYVIEGQKYHGTACYAAILDYLFFRGISDATVTRGIAGFGTDHKLHTSRLVELADQMPIKIEFVETRRTRRGSAAQADRDRLARADRSAGHDGHQSCIAEKQRPQACAAVAKLQSTAKIMRILIGEHDRWQDKPLHQALVQALRANDIAGVTVYRGILGYGANRRMHKDSALNLSHDAPILLTVVDTEEKLRAFFPVLDQMVKQGLVVMSDAEVIKYSHAEPLGERGEADVKLEGKAKMLRIHFGEDDKWQGPAAVPGHRRAMPPTRNCRSRPCSAASKATAPAPSFAAGTCSAFRPTRPSWCRSSTPTKTFSACCQSLDEMIFDGLIAISDVEVIKYVHQDGQHPQT